MTSATNPSRTAVALRRTASATAIIASALLMGCVDDLTAAAISDPATHHPIAYSAAPETLIVEIVPAGPGLTPNQTADVWRFVQRFKAESTGSLRVEIPGKGRPWGALGKSVQQVEEIINRSGIDPRAAAYVHTGGKGAHAGALILTYDRTIAVPPDCGDWSDDLGENRERLPYNNFGCATQRNLALTVNNGRDLQIPQEETARSSERRASTWSDYVGAKGSSGDVSASTGAAGAAGAATGK
jgi:pilus assembly protein CpaD